MSSVASLLDSQLTPKQQQLLAAILYPVIRQDLNEAATWSQWSFARSTLRKEQLDADQGVIATLGRNLRVSRVRTDLAGHADGVFTNPTAREGRVDHGRPVPDRP